MYYFCLAFFCLAADAGRPGAEGGRAAFTLLSQGCLYPVIAGPPLFYLKIRRRELRPALDIQASLKTGSVLSFRFAPVFPYTSSGSILKYLSRASWYIRL